MPGLHRQRDSATAQEVCRVIDESGGELSATSVDLLCEMYSATHLGGTLSDELVALEPGTKIPVEQGAILHGMAVQHQVRSSLEIGFAYGFSTVFLIDAIARNGGGSHTAVDPFELSVWEGVGLRQVAKLDCKGCSFEWIEAPSIVALPPLHAAADRFDLIFIDGNHRFDDTIVDFYVSDPVLRPGGLLIFDDLWMPSIQTAVAFVLENCSYQRVQQSHGNMAVLRKEADDDRQWDHFRSFRVAGNVESRLPKIRLPGLWRGNR